MSSYLNPTMDKAPKRCAYKKAVTFQFKKIDAKTGKGLAGAIFELRRCKKVTALSTSDSRGYVSFSRLRPGKYILTETAPPAGYLPASRSFTVLVDPCGNITVDQKPARHFTVCAFRPSDIYADLTGIKYDIQSQARLAGAAFGLFDGPDLVQESISDAAGCFYFDHLSPGCYLLMELEPPAGYQLIPTIYQICVSEEGAVSVDGEETDTLFIGNRTAQLDLKFYSRDTTTNAPVCGASFELLQGSRLISTTVSAPDGLVSFRFLKAGSYTLLETLPAPGYLPHRHAYAVIITADGDITVDGVPAEAFILKNEPFLFQLHKTDLNGQPLEGALFRLAAEDENISYEFFSGIDGFITFQQVPPGSYTLTEITPPAGYQPNPDSYAVEISEDGSVLIGHPPSRLLPVTSTPLTSQSTFLKDASPDGAPNLQFTKTDASGTPLAKALFTLHSENGILREAVSDIDGRVFFENVPEGTYTLREQTPPPNYLPCSTAHTVVMPANGAAQIGPLPAEEFTALSYEAPNVYLLKASAEGDALEGAVFELRQNDLPIDALITDASGWGAFFRLLPGDYTIVETQAPAGYDPDPRIRKVSVSPDGMLTIDEKPTQYITAVNKPATIDLSGEIIWEDLDNIYKTRPEQVRVLLYQNGLFLQQLDLPSTAVSFTFSDLPKNDPAGLPYLYTTGEENTPEGYTKEISGLQITNTLSTVTVTASYCESGQIRPLIQDVYPVLYGSDLTVIAPFLVGYQLVSEPSRAYTGLTQDQEHTFLYTKRSKKTTD